MIFPIVLGLILINSASQEGELNTTVTGRLVDDWVAPVAEAQCVVSIYTPSETLRVHTRTDGDGRFEFRIDSEFWATTRGVTINRIGPQFLGKLAIANVKSFDGLRDLGSIRFCSIEESARLIAKNVRTLTDEDLEHSYRHLGGPIHQDVCLTEMARRCSPKWVEFLSEAWSQTKKRGPATSTLIIALRRAQNRPSPLQFEIEYLRNRHLKIGDRIDIDSRIVNSDISDSIIISGMGGADERCDHVFVEAVGPDGNAIVCRTIEGSIIGTSGFTQALSPGEAVSFSVALASYINFTQVGIYQIRLHYYGKASIGYGYSVAGLLTVASPWFEVCLR